jgi:hypothetical protein
VAAWREGLLARAVLAGRAYAYGDEEYEEYVRRVVGFFDKYLLGK